MSMEACRTMVPGTLLRAKREGLAIAIGNPPLAVMGFTVLGIQPKRKSFLVNTKEGTWQGITPKLVRDKVATMVNSLKMDFGIRKPKIALLGINPHSGDNGTIGEEDDKILKPVVQELFNKGILVYGPYSADSFFGSNTHQNFDAVLAAYHDQGLIPFKTLSFGKGVNYTAGLSKVRTSPDHGTAYEIAGKGEADESSFKEAVFTSIQVLRNREEYLTLNKNPLQKQKTKKAS